VRQAFAVTLAVALGAGGPALAEERDPINGHPLENGAAAVEELGDYERQALERALALRGLSLVETARGKRIRRIHIVNLNVFDDDARLLLWINAMRRATRDHVIARELLIAEGEPWQVETVEETRRNIEDPKFTSLVVIQPVRAVERPGHAAAGDDVVDLLVVTRDVWSLRPAVSFELQQGSLSALNLSLKESNFLGRRKAAQVRYEMALGSTSVGAIYEDPNIAGSRVLFEGSAYGVLARDTNELEGSRGELRLAYPLWSLDRRWGASLSLTHDDTIARSFRGGELRRYDAPETPGDDALPWEYDHRALLVESELVHSMGRATLHRFAFGHELEVSRPSVLDNFPGDDTQRAAFERDVLPRSERTSALYGRYQLYEPRYSIYRDLDTFDLSEHRQIGPDIELRLSAGGAALGSEARFLRGRGRLGLSVDVAGDGMLPAPVEGDARLQGGELIDNELIAGVYAASPRVADMLRLVARVDVMARIHETSNRFYELGGLTGLRGYPINHYAGRRQVRANLEARSKGLPAGLFRAGLVGFWDAGHAADSFDEISLRHDLGVGIRFLAPQLSRSLFRIDYAVPLHGSDAGFPGRITAGGSQVF
jgi:hypothetical protein